MQQNGTASLNLGTFFHSTVYNSENISVGYENGAVDLKRKKTAWNLGIYVCI